MSTYEACETIKVHAANARGYRIINASAFDPAVHVRFGAPVEPQMPTNDEITFARGPRGKWFANRDGERLAPGYDTEAEARAAHGG